MLPKKNRLNKKEVEFIFKKGKTYKQGFLIFKKIEDKKLPCSCFSVIVPTRVSKKTVERNRIKRQIRESLRKKLPKIRPKIKGIFITLPNIIKKDYKVIDQNINKIIEISKIRK